MSKDNENLNDYIREESNNLGLLKFVENIRDILKEVKDTDGVSLLNEEVLSNTPKRYIKSLMEFTSGYYIDEKALLESALFPSEGFNNIIIIDDIEFDSLCEHHLLPFSGVVKIGYIPNKLLLGLSKFARLVEVFSKRLSLQERLTKQIAESIEANLNPLGVVVEINSIHSCMCVRGVKSKSSSTKTIYTLGKFNDNDTLNKYFQLRSK